METPQDTRIVTDVRIIKIQTCIECPFIHEDDGGGYCASFVKCEKFNIMLFDWDGPEDFEYRSGIHPKCRLAKEIKNEGN